MKIIKGFKQAGEPTEAIPLELCKQARDSLKIWQYTTLEQMQARLKAEIESINRLEYVVIDDTGAAKAMMILDVYENEPHTGHDILFTKFSFSTDKGALNNGYKWLLKMAKIMNFKFIMTTRQTGPMEIRHKIREVKP
ncbi:hypothetical protein OXE08_004523 [Salmonella enterica]|nr:hypothetical protein [Salmonella enterica]